MCLDLLHAFMQFSIAPQLLSTVLDGYEKMLHWGWSLKRSGLARTVEMSGPPRTCSGLTWAAAIAPQLALNSADGHCSSGCKLPS